LRTINVNLELFRKFDNNTVTAIIRPLLPKEIEVQEVRWVQTVHNTNHAVIIDKFGQPYKFHNPFGQDGSHFMIRSGLLLRRVRAKTTVLCQAKDIKEETLVQCGFGSKPEFIKSWNKNNITWKDNLYVWVVTI
jgi:hypothetical protein